MNETIATGAVMENGVEAMDSVTSTGYGPVVTGVINMIMLIGMWIMKLKKRLQSNETRVEQLERKLSKMDKREPAK